MSLNYSNIGIDPKTLNSDTRLNIILKAGEESPIKMVFPETDYLYVSSPNSDEMLFDVPLSQLDPL